MTTKKEKRAEVLKRVAALQGKRVRVTIPRVEGLEPFIRTSTITRFSLKGTRIDIWGLKDGYFFAGGETIQELYQLSWLELFDLVRVFWGDSPSRGSGRLLRFGLIERSGLLNLKLTELGRQVLERKVGEPIEIPVGEPIIFPTKGAQR